MHDASSAAQLRVLRHGSTSARYRPRGPRRTELQPVPRQTREALTRALATHADTRAPQLPAIGERWLHGRRCAHPHSRLDQIAIGRSIAWLSLTANVWSGEVAVKVMFNADVSEGAMAAMALDRASIQKQIGLPLVWVTGQERRQQGIKVVEKAALADRASWPAATAWLAKTARSSVRRRPSTAPNALPSPFTSDDERIHHRW